MGLDLRKAKPSVAIVLVNYNGFEDTVECVSSLNKISYPYYKIVVVDNGSTKRPNLEQKKILLENTYYIESHENLGFSGGNNLGIAWAMEQGYEYVLLLNNDTTVEPNFLDILIDAAESKENVGVVGGKISFYNNPNLLWFGGGQLNTKYGCGSHERWNQPNSEDTGEIREVTFLTGCLMLIPMSVIKVVGYLDKDYFLYAEDTDYCCRITNYGYKLWFCENTLVYHKVSASTGAASPMTQYYMVRNALYLSKRYLESHLIVQFRVFLAEIKAVIRGRKQLKPILCAFKDYYKGITGKWDN